MTDFKIGNIAFGPSMKEFDKFFVGYDQQFDRLAKMSEDFAKNIPNYPPYNIKKTGDNTYAIEIAVAGFTKSDIEITVDDDKLTVKGSSKEDTNAETFLFKGIGLRDFTRTFALNDQVEIKGAAMFNGLLKIALERLVPEHKKPKKVDISDDESAVSKTTKRGTTQYLTEDQL
jgi:molecular chaperone IbpA